MRGTILIYQPPEQCADAVRDAFRQVVGELWRVELVTSADELTSPEHHSAGEHLLAVVPSQTGNPDLTSAALVRSIRQTDPDVPVVVTAEVGNVDAAAEAVRDGATDFLVLGENLSERVATLLGKLRRIWEVIDRNRLLDEQNARLRGEIQTRFHIVGDSPPMQRLMDQVRRVAPVPRPVLIIGERGTGKEQIARAIHYAAGGRDGALITINCAAVGDALLESELFGHDQGAFTGADTSRRGKFELADGGTLFLDEIGHMSLPFQQKILRVVEYGTFMRVGGSEDRATTARIIAATNCDLDERIERREFLPDLYDRLSFETLRVPPLRQRREDIEALALHFLDEFAKQATAFAGKRLSGAAIAGLCAYSFPGNVRELKNIIERAAFRDTTEEITPEDLGLRESSTAPPTEGTYYEQLDEVARRLLSEAMRESANNQAQAARSLGLSYHQFRYYYGKLLRAGGPPERGNGEPA